MKKFTTIKQLIIDEILSNNELPTYSDLTEKIKENFPNSKWQKSHYSWYKSQIKTGKIEIEDLLNDFENLETEETVDKNLIEFSVSLEKDLHNYLSANLNEIEKHLKIVENGIEYSTEAGFIDILAMDKDESYVVIELKAGKAKDAALGQLLGYIGSIMEEKSTTKVRGILIASDFENRIIFGTKAISNIKVVKYKLNFQFNTL